MRHGAVTLALAALAALVATLAGSAALGGAAKDKKDANTPPPASNLDYWLNQARPVEPKGEAPEPPAEPTSPFGEGKDAFRRPDALPGVIELSNGKQLPGGVYTTVEKPWIVWSEATKSWRRIPFIALLSITAVVEEERVELRWRWKGMGEPEKVYTGEKYPLRRLHWRFKLIDGSVVEGSTKGQPVWVEFHEKAYGPWVLHERMKGNDGQTLEDLVYVKKVVVSRKMMDAVVADVEKQWAEQARPKADRPAPKKDG